MALGSIGTALASAADGPEQVEASMHVAGMLTLQQDGGVASVELTDETALPAIVSERIRQTIAGWHFDPMNDGNALPEKLPMNLLLVAKLGSEGKYQVAIRSAHFGQQGLECDERAVRRYASTTLPSGSL